MQHLCPAAPSQADEETPLGHRQTLCEGWGRGEFTVTHVGILSGRFIIVRTSVGLLADGRHGHYVATAHRKDFVYCLVNPISPAMCATLASSMAYRLLKLLMKSASVRPASISGRLIAFGHAMQTCRLYARCCDCRLERHERWRLRRSPAASRDLIRYPIARYSGYQRISRGRRPGVTDDGG
jgi:hypothetical protein